MIILQVGIACRVVMSGKNHKTDKKGQSMENVTIPEVWAPECQYCITQAQWGADHETEILDRARKFCSNPHFYDFVFSELDWLDHAKATPPYQIRLLSKIHDKTGCHCQDHLTETVQDRLVSKDGDLHKRKIDNDTCELIDARGAAVVVSHTVPSRIQDQHAFSPKDLARLVREPRTHKIKINKSSVRR